MLSELQSVLSLLDGGFGDLNILVIGDLMLDRYVLGEVNRISPEAPVPVLRHISRYARPGGAANVAMNLHGLGCAVRLAGFWGSDSEQAELADILKATQIDSSYVKTSERSTTSKTRIVADTQHLLRLDTESLEPYTMEENERLEASVIPLIADADVVILSDYAKGVLTASLCEAVVTAARAAGVPVFVDPKSKDFSKYRGATAVCPNLSELAAATGVAAHDTQNLLAAAQQLLTAYGFDFLAVTMSKEGITVIQRDGSFHSPARAREVYDVSGAGDTVIAVLATCHAAGLQRSTAAELANIAAGIVIGKMGTAPIDSHELVSELTHEASLSSENKVMELEQLVHRIAHWRATGKTIVFTNGCFDLIHVGHIKLFEDCSRLGSKVIVGLNTDSSVRRLKGETRPIVRERERAQVIAALAAVDAVTFFDQDTPLELIRVLKPDILVKGGDYKVETVIGHEDVLSWGGRVHIVPMVEGFSTTNIVGKL